ncbi:MAG: hypothetical protein V3U70_04370 [Thermoplasmata archaeon]
MIREYFFLAKREGEEDPRPLQILHVSMGSLRLITAGRVLGGLRRAGSMISWIVFILLFTVFPLLFGFALRDPVVTALVILGVTSLGVLLGLFIPRAAARRAARNPTDQMSLSVIEAHLRRWYHMVTVRGNGEEFVLRVQGRRRSLAEALAMTGHPIAPWR